VKEALKDFAKMTNLINEGVPLSKFCIPNISDILLEAIIQKKIVVFNKIINMGFDIKAGEFLYLHHAIRTKDIRYIKPILDKVGLDINYINKQDLEMQNNALHIAIAMNVSDNIIVLLSKSMINWNTQNKNGQTPLHFLLRSRMIDKSIMNELINNEIDLNIKDNMGISSIDIINSFALNKNWKNTEMSKELLQIINKDTNEDKNG
jgi:ankyrin repeat protein